MRTISCVFSSKKKVRWKNDNYRNVWKCFSFWYFTIYLIQLIEYWTAIKFGSLKKILRNIFKKKTSDLLFCLFRVCNTIYVHLQWVYAMLCYVLHSTHSDVYTVEFDQIMRLFDVRQFYEILVLGREYLNICKNRQLIFTAGFTISIYNIVHAKSADW